MRIVGDDISNGTVRQNAVVLLAGYFLDHKTEQCVHGVASGPCDAGLEHRLTPQDEG